MSFNQLIEYSFNQNYIGYNELAKTNNVDFYLGKNASSLNSEYPLLNARTVFLYVFFSFLKFFNFKFTNFTQPYKIRLILYQIANFLVNYQFLIFFILMLYLFFSMYI